MAWLDSTESAGLRMPESTKATALASVDPRQEQLMLHSAPPTPPPLFFLFFLTSTAKLSTLPGLMQIRETFQVGGKRSK